MGAFNGAGRIGPKTVSNPYRVVESDAPDRGSATDQARMTSPGGDVRVRRTVPQDRAFGLTAVRYWLLAGLITLVVGLGCFALGRANRDTDSNDAFTPSVADDVGSPEGLTRSVAGRSPSEPVKDPGVTRTRVQIEPNGDGPAGPVTTEVARALGPEDGRADGDGGDSAVEGPPRAGDDGRPGPVEPSTLNPGRVDTEARRTKVEAAAGPKAVARYEGLASPGLKIMLNATGSHGQGLKYHWVQTRGPKAVADRLDRPKVEVTVPGNATELAFTLLVVGANGADSAELAIPLELRPDSGPPPELRADAGDDQVGVVGHQITLNGLRSTPRGRLTYRWMQAEGPKAETLTQDGWACSFTPRTPGVYRFLLVVSAGGAISDPGEVRVVVSEAPPRVATERPSSSVLPVEDQSRNLLLALPGGLAVGRPLAEAFEGVGERMSLYESYNNVQQELALRLNDHLPSDPAMRAVWNDRLFTPLSGRIVEALQREGLDLGRPEARSVALTEPQKDAIRRVFRLIAAGLRSVPGTQPADRSAP